MAIRFKKMSRLLIPTDKNSERRIFPVVTYKYDRPATLREFAKNIAKQSAMGEGEVYNVLKYFCLLLQELLLDGRYVNIDGFGCFYLSLQGKGAPDVESFTVNDITGLRICFRASNDIRIHNGTTTRTEGLTFIDVDKVNGTDPTFDSGSDSDSDSGSQGGTDPDTGSGGSGSGEDGDNPIG